MQRERPRSILHLAPLGLATALTLAALPARAQPQRLIELSAQDAAARMAAMRATWSTADEWRARAAAVRAHLAATLDLPTIGPEGVDPDASRRGPLEPLVHEARVYEEYVVEDVSFRSFDGSRLAGNLYRPMRSRGLHAAVLCVHGHFGATPEDPEGRFRRDMQLRCASLARMGAVVFAYDMVGWAESDLAGHDSPAALPLQTYNSVRAVDYLLSRADVDPGRVAITGASGGGSQTFILSALDPRVSASIPCVMVSSHFFGGCMCETGLPLHSGEGLATNNVEIAALAAPRPLLLISCGGDWTSHTPEIEFPAVREVYTALREPERVANAHFADEGHDYGPSKRAALYRFLGREFGLDASEVLSEDGRPAEAFVTIEPRGTLFAREGDTERTPAPEALERLRLTTAGTRP